MTDFFFGLWLFSRFLSLVFTNLNSVCVGVLLSNSWTSGLMCFIVSDHYLFNYFFYTVLSPFSSKISTTNILNCLILSYNLVLFIFFPFCVSLWIRFTNFLSNCVVYWWPWKKTVHLWYHVLFLPFRYHSLFLLFAKNSPSIPRVLSTFFIESCIILSLFRILSFHIQLPLSVTVHYLASTMFGLSFFVHVEIYT